MSVPAGAVSVVMPAYLSCATIAACLSSLMRQSLPLHEIVVVVSGPSDGLIELVRAEFPVVTVIPSPDRLLPHAARNVGVAATTGELLLFTDPDMEFAADTVALMVDAYRTHPGLIAGGLACAGGGWLDRGVHLTKFSKWLPTRRARPVDVAPTAAMLCSRALYEELGGFRGDEILDDARFSWEARRHGADVWLAARTVAYHRHTHRLGTFLRERFQRGMRFGRMRSSYEGYSRLRAMGFLAVSLLPVRFAKALGLVALHAIRTGHASDLATTLPVVALGFAASLWGEGLAYGRRALESRAGARAV